MYIKGVCRQCRALKKVIINPDGKPICRECYDYEKSNPDEYDW